MNTDQAQAITHLLREMGFAPEIVADGWEGDIIYVPFTEVHIRRNPFSDIEATLAMLKKAFSNVDDPPDASLVLSKLAKAMHEEIPNLQNPQTPHGTYPYEARSYRRGVNDAYTAAMDAIERAYCAVGLPRRREPKGRSDD